MQLEIIVTTDGQHLGRVIDAAERPITLSDDEVFNADCIVQIGPKMWRLRNSNYVIDAKEISNV